MYQRHVYIDLHIVIANSWRPVAHDDVFAPPPPPRVKGDMVLGVGGILLTKVMILLLQTPYLHMLQSHFLEVDMFWRQI